MKVVVTGSGGFIGARMASHLAKAGHSVTGTLRSTLDLIDTGSIAAKLGSLAPEAVVHCAAVPDLLTCHRDPGLARRVNTLATAAIGEWCKSAGARLIFLSTDQVFNGSRGHYTEADPPDPVNEYGKSKARAESRLLAKGGLVTVMRISLCYGFSTTDGLRSVSGSLVSKLRNAQSVRLHTDEFRTPVLVDDVCSAAGELIEMTKPPTLLHLAGPDRLSRHEFGLAIAHAFTLPVDSILGVSTASSQNPNADLPVRPLDVSLDTQLAGNLLRTAPRRVQEGLRKAAADEARHAANDGFSRSPKTE